MEQLNAAGKQGQIPVAVTRLELATEQLAKAVDTLEQRLFSILGEEPPKNKLAIEDKPAPRACSLAEQITARCYQLEAISFRITSLVQRSEL